jgi:hypothetical protein
MKLAAAILSLVLPLSAQTYGTTQAGAGCGGATLTVTFTSFGNGGNARIDIRGEGLHPNSVAGMTFGVQPAAIGPVLGNIGCFVRTEAIWAQHHLTDAAGVMTWSRSWPDSVVGYYLIQLGSFDATTLEVKLTNCVRAAHE